MNTPHRNSQTRSKHTHVFYGCTFVGCGLVGIITPVVPGIALILLGVVLLAPRARVVRALLLRVEQHAPKAYRAGKRYAARFGVCL